MSEDKKSSEHLTEGDEPSIEAADTSALGSNAQAINNNQEELPAGAVGGSQHETLGATGINQEGLPSSGFVINQEGFPPYAIGQEELAGAIGCSQGASAASGAVPKVVLGMEDVQKAFLANARNQLNQFQSIKDELLETIRDLKQQARRNPGNWGFFERLREHINEAYAFLDEIKEAMSIQESREEYLNLQMNQFFERRREEGENFKGTTLRVGTIDGVDVTIKTAVRAPDEQDDDSLGEKLDKSKIAKALVDHVFESARGQQNAVEASGEARLEAAAVGVDVERVPNEPYARNVADANMDDEDDGMRLGPIVTGKYTLAIRAHQLCLDSSSEDSLPEEIDQYPQGENRNVLRRDNEAVEERMVEDPPDSPNDSPAEESSHQL